VRVLLEDESFLTANLLVERRFDTAETLVVVADEPMTCAPILEVRVIRAASAQNRPTSELQRLHARL
jgi:hypothetical protein